MKPIIIIKFGTGSITSPDGKIDQLKIEKICSQVVALRESYHIIIVSSGAIIAGKELMPEFNETYLEKRVAGLIGNRIILNLYEKYLKKDNIKIAECLCEKGHFTSDNQIQQLIDNFKTILGLEIIPIANENDIAMTKESKFADNDELATLLAIHLKAQTLMFCTATDGLLNKEGRTISHIKKIDQEIMSNINSNRSAFGAGGMISKLNFIKSVVDKKIEVIIFGSNKDNFILEALRRNWGTYISPE